MAKSLSLAKQAGAMLLCALKRDEIDHRASGCCLSTPLRTLR